MTSQSPLPDPFDTAGLRDATLTAWRTSPTRLSEDATAEADLAGIGYRDRLITELAANAADAAAEGDVAGRLRFRVDGSRLRVANTGAPLTTEGVRALTALRVSPKASPGSVSLAKGEVGRFGVGFRATSFLPRVDVLSTSGGITFDARSTLDAIAEAGIDLQVGATVPVQRLAWPTYEAPADGFDTEVVLHTASPDQAETLLSQARGEAEDLLLELDSLEEIDCGGQVFTREVDGDVVTIVVDGKPSRRWLTSGRFDTAFGPVRWLVPIDENDVPQPLTSDVLRSPTPTNVQLALPARLIAGLPLIPDRRGLHPDVDIAVAAAGYPELMALVRDDSKHLLIPELRLGAAGDAARLRKAIDDVLRTAAWVPPASTRSLSLSKRISPERAWILRGLTPELAEVLGDLIGPLVHPDLSDGPAQRALLRMGARDLGLAELADLLSGTEREPAWWGRLYDALTPLVPDATAVAELGAIPVPRADGRMHTGARGLFVVDGVDELPPGADWVPVVAPEAYRPLLDRLGLEHLGVTEVLAHPALPAALESADDHEDLADAVLTLLAADENAQAPATVGRVELRGADGDLWPADELLLPSAPLREVLADDGDEPEFGIADQAVVDAYSESALRRLGVGWGFTVVREDLPTGPDHELDAEDEWWESLEVPPDSVRAVRDLDLVDPERWAQALDLLLDDEDTRVLLADSDGYTVWWLRRFAEIDGRPLREWRSPDDESVRGLLDPLPYPRAAEVPVLLGSVRIEDADEAQARLSALADAEREVLPGVAARAHAGLVDAVRAGRVGVSELDSPDGVRTLAGTVAADAVVLDAPWWVAVLPSDGVVASEPVDPESAAVLADLLDLPIATQKYSARVVSEGATVDPDSAAALRMAVATGLRPEAGLVVHDDLTVAVFADDEELGRHRVPRWRDDSGTWHINS